MDTNTVGRSIGRFLRFTQTTVVVVAKGTVQHTKSLAHGIAEGYAPKPSIAEFEQPAAPKRGKQAVA